MNLIRYFMDKSWRKSVNEQIQLEKKIASHTEDVMISMGIGLMAILGGFMPLFPAWEFVREGEYYLLLQGAFLPAISVDLYNRRFLQIEESGKKINIFSKYKNIPVEHRLLVTAKTMLLARRCFILGGIYQLLNFCVRMGIYSMTGVVHWNVCNIYPMGVMLFIFLAEYARIRFYAAQA